MSSGWRRRYVAREAIANAASSSVRTMVFSFICVLGFGTVAMAELFEVGRLLERIEHLREQGVDVVTITSEEGDVIEAKACASLEEMDHVTSSGSVINVGEIEFTRAPGVRFQLLEITPGMLPIWGLGSRVPHSATWIMGEAAAEELALQPGDLVSEIGGQPLPVTVIPAGVRSQFADRSVMSLVPARGEDAACWVDFAPGASAGGRRALFSAFPGAEVSVRPVVQIDDESVLGSQWNRSSGQQAWASIGVLIALTLAALAFGRRSDIAVYRAFGLSRTGVLSMHQWEAVAIVGSASCMAVGWSIVIYAVQKGLPEIAQTEAALRSVIGAVCLVILLGPYLATAAGTGSPATLLKQDN